MTARRRRSLLLAAAALAAGAVAVGADVAAGGLLAGLDGPAGATGQAARGPSLTPVALAVSDLGATPARAVLAAAVAVPLAVRWRSWRPVVLAALAVGLSPAVSAGLKRIVNRARPAAADALVAPVDPSFPSGHATASAALATALAVLGVLAVRSAWGRSAAVVVAVAFAGGVGLTRVYLGAHWLTDVLAGWLLGAALALLLAALVGVGPRPASPRGDR